MTVVTRQCMARKNIKKMIESWCKSTKKKKNFPSPLQTKGEKFKKRIFYAAKQNVAISLERKIDFFLFVLFFFSSLLTFMPFDTGHA
jgi:hypothetical protein